MSKRGPRITCLLDLQLLLSTVSEQPKQPPTSSRSIAPFNSGGRQTLSSVGGEERESRKNSAVSGLVTLHLPGDAPSTREAVIAPAEIGLGTPRFDQSALPSQDTLPDNKSPTLPGEVKQRPGTALYCHHDQMDCVSTQHHGTTSSKKESAEEGEIGVVKLLKAKMIPAGYRRMARTQVAGELQTAMLLFTPGPHGGDVLLADAVVEGPCATQITGNKGLQPIYLTPPWDCGACQRSEVV